MLFHHDFNLHFPIYACAGASFGIICMGCSGFLVCELLLHVLHQFFYCIVPLSC